MNGNGWMQRVKKSKNISYKVQKISYFHLQVYTPVGWVDKRTGEIRNTFSLLTNQANELMAKIHNTKQRMPVILHPDDESAWLAGSDYKQFAYPYETSLQTFLI